MSDDFLKDFEDELNAWPESDLYPLMATLKAVILKGDSSRRPSRFDFHFTSENGVGNPCRGQISGYYNSAKYPSPHSPDGTLTIQRIAVTPRGTGFVHYFVSSLFLDEDLKEIKMDKVLIESILSERFVDSLLERGWTPVPFQETTVYLTRPFEQSM